MIDRYISLFLKVLKLFLNLRRSLTVSLRITGTELSSKLTLVTMLPLGRLKFKADERASPRHPRWRLRLSRDHVTSELRINFIRFISSAKGEHPYITQRPIKILLCQPESPPLFFFFLIKNYKYVIQRPIILDFFDTKITMYKKKKKRKKNHNFPPNTVYWDSSVSRKDLLCVKSCTSHPKTSLFCVQFLPH